MARKRIPWWATITIMILLFAAILGAAFLDGFPDAETYVILNVSTGAATMLIIILLCVAYSMDHAPQDNTAWFFFTLLVSTFIGLLTDNISSLLDGRPDWSLANHILCFVSYLIGAFIVPVFFVYQRLVFSIPTPKKFLRFTQIFMILDIVFLLVSAIGGFLYTIDPDGRYQVEFGHYLAAIYPSVVTILTIIDNLRQKISLRKRLVLLAFDLAPMLGLLSALFAPYSVTYVLVAYALLLIYCAVQMEHGVEQAEQTAQLAEQSSRLAQQSRIMAEQSRDLTEMKTQIMLSQIQPHFIYNTLGSISSLCIDNPSLAADVTDQFARYLRMNMANMGNSNLIPFETELEHTKTFLWIEQIRFPDYLRIDYRISCTDFSLPPLTLQPLVENAVKHGITPKEEGGTVTIDVHKTQRDYVIVVSDDGVGFDPQAPHADGRPHLGIENVRKRLMILCKGTLTIESQAGAGTVATITIPRGDA